MDTYAGSPLRHGKVTEAQIVSEPRSVLAGGKTGARHGNAVSALTLHPLVQ